MRVVVQTAFLALLLASNPVKASATALPESALSPHLGQRATVVVFISVGCPVSNAYLPHLNDLAKKYREKGVALVGVHSNDQDTAADIEQHRKEFAVAFPVIKDDSQCLADALGAERVPEAVVLDGKQIVLYRGRIDDRYAVGGRKDQPTRTELVAAIDELLAGKKISVARTEVSGCLIGRTAERKVEPITYTKQVVRIIQAKCQSCHRADGVAPFALTDFDRIKGWAKTIKEVVVERRMPPWHADPRFGKFANDRSLSQAEIDTLVAWIDGGLARGDDRDLPPVAVFPKGGWSIRTPDAVLAMPKEFDVPASGVLPYQHFIVETGFKEDRWIERAQVLPGSKTVHHAVVFVDGAGMGDPLCTYVPGDSPMILAPGVARRLPAGAKLRFNMHYTPTGKAEKDRTVLGLVFAKEPPKREVRMLMLNKGDIQIPPQTADHREEKSITIPREVRMVSFFPHMHVRGKSWECQVTYPDGRSETFLKVPRYDFNWQHTYRFTEPMLLPAGSQVRCIAHYDNSKGNPANPDPSKTVKFGPQTWDEMMAAGLEYVVDARADEPNQPPSVQLAERVTGDIVHKAGQLLAAQARGLKDLPFQATPNAEGTFIWRFGDRAVAVLPDKQLNQEALANAAGDVLPIGHMWLKGMAVAPDGKAAPAEQMRMVAISAGGQQQELALCLLGVRKQGNDLQLLVFGKDREPLLRVLLESAENSQSTPIDLGIRQAPNEADVVTVRVLGKYQAALPLVQR